MIHECKNFHNGSSSYNDPFCFSSEEHLSSEGIRKDWSSYYDCNEFECDYTALTEAFQSTFYDFDGVLYSVNINTTCSSSTEKYIDIGFPTCVSPSCTRLFPLRFSTYFI